MVLWPLASARRTLCALGRKVKVGACAVPQSEPREGHQLTLKQNGKTRTVYVPQDLKDEVQSSIREHRRIKKLLQEITQLQLALIRAHVTQQRRRGGRA